MPDRIVRAFVESLAWESEFFKLRTGRLTFAPDAPPLSAAALDDYALTQAKIPASDPALADALGALGFRLAESEVDLCLPVTVEDGDGGLGAGCRTAQAADIPALRQAAAQAFAQSRFRPPWYRAGDGGRLYARWAENAVLGSYDHVCLLLEEDGQPQGWVTLRRLDEREGRIGLLAAWPGRTGRGVGARLMRAARAWCGRQGLLRLRVGTQLGNVAALRLYLRSGASVEHTSYWLYR